MPSLWETGAQTMAAVEAELVRNDGDLGTHVFATMRAELRASMKHRPAKYFVRKTPASNLGVRC